MTHSTRVRPGFTIMEIMISLVVIAVLAGLAVPAYRSVTERSRASEAQVNLNAIHMAQKNYHARYDTFWGNSTVWANVSAGLSIELNNRYYDIQAFNANAAMYTVTLIRNAVERTGAGTKTFTVTYNAGNQAPVFTEGGAY